LPALESDGDEPPDELPDVEDESEPVDEDVEAESESPLDPEESGVPEIFRLFPDLKSVSYQPPPFRRKPAAETFLTSALSVQAGHTSSGSSLIF
jgi:hypothetical protein